MKLVECTRHLGQRQSMSLLRAAWVSCLYPFPLPYPQFLWGNVEYPSWKLYAQWGYEQTHPTFSWIEALFLLSWSENKICYTVSMFQGYLLNKHSWNNLKHKLSTLLHKIIRKARDPLIVSQQEYWVHICAH